MMGTIRMKCALLGLFFFIGVAAPPLANAQTTSQTLKQASDTLFEEGRSLFENGDYAGAAKKLEEARKIRDTTGAKLLLAKCYEKLGKLASARALFMDVLRDIGPEPSDEKAVRRSQDATAGLAAIEPRLSRLTIKVPAEVVRIPGLVVIQDGTALLPKEWGIAAPVDPGVHMIEVTALGKEPWKTTSEIVGENQAITVHVEPPWVEFAKREENSKSESVAKTVPEKKPGDEKTPDPAPSPSSPSSSRALGGLGVAGVGLGVVGLVLSGYFTYQASSSNTESNAGNCDGRDHCNQAGYDLRMEALASGDKATAFFVAGGALLVGGGGLLLYWKSKGKDVERGGAKTTLMIGPNWVGARGAW